MAAEAALKHRVDVQEAQLIEGMSPTAAGYGIEPEGMEGMLTLADENNQLHAELVPAEKGNYRGYLMPYMRPFEKINLTWFSKTI